MRCGAPARGKVKVKVEAQATVARPCGSCLLNQTTSTNKFLSRGNFSLLENLACKRTHRYSSRPFTNMTRFARQVHVLRQTSHKRQRVATSGEFAERTVRESSTESTTKSLFLDRKTCETDVSGAILQSRIESSYLHAESNP